MGFTIRLWKDARALIVLFLIALTLFLPAFYYISLSLDAALLRRSVRKLQQQRETWLRKNDALRKALQGVAGRQKHSQLSVSGNRVIRLQMGLPASLKEE